MLIYTRHARQRMRQRNISASEVEYSLKHHHISYTDKKGNPNYIAKTLDGRRIKVVVKKENPNTVITVGD